MVYIDRLSATNLHLLTSRETLKNVSPVEGRSTSQSFISSLKFVLILASFQDIIINWDTFFLLYDIRCSILACSAYVALGLGDNVMALAHAQRLLSQSNLLGALKSVNDTYSISNKFSLWQNVNYSSIMTWR